MDRRGKYRMFLFFLLAAGMITLVWYTKINIEKRIPENVDEYIKQALVGDENNVAAEKNGQTYVYPCGFPIGVYLETEGVMVIGTGTVTDTEGITHEPVVVGIQAGDYIVALNDIDVSSKSQLTFLINKYGSREIVLKVKRNDEFIDVKARPIKVSSGEYKLGIWVRDDSQGIGSMTFITSNGEFGALGHGISDVDTGELLNAAGGTLYGASIWGIRKGESGKPGGLYGVISYEDKNILGEIIENTDIGIYGTIDAKAVIDEFDLEPFVVAKKEEIKEGKAYIRTCVSGKIEDYEIKIENVDLSCDTNKGMVIRVTDKKLLELTNGIVQGMSGSPIIQDGKLIGAVTHVFVKDASKGYGVFIETMLGQ